MLLSAVSILVVAQSSSEIPEGLMNNPVQQGLVWFYAAYLWSDSLDDGPLQIETLRYVQCDIIKYRRNIIVRFVG